MCSGLPFVPIILHSFLITTSRDFTLLNLMLPRFFTLLFLATSPSVMHMLADTIGVVAKDVVDAQYPMTLPVLTLTIPGAINCTIAQGVEKTACDDWSQDVENHVFKGDPVKCSGAHLMSCWNHGDKWEHPTSVGMSGIAGGRKDFQAKGGPWCSQNPKFVWNDVDTIQHDGHVYTKDEVREMCIKAFYYARVASKGKNPGKNSYIVDTGYKTQTGKGTGEGICVRASYNSVNWKTAESCFPWNSKGYDEKKAGNSCNL